MEIYFSWVSIGYHLSHHDQRSYLCYSWTIKWLYTLLSSVSHHYQRASPYLFQTTQLQFDWENYSLILISPESSNSTSLFGSRFINFHTRTKNCSTWTPEQKYLQAIKSKLQNKKNQHKHYIKWYEKCIRKTLSTIYKISHKTNASLNSKLQQSHNARNHQKNLQKNSISFPLSLHIIMVKTHSCYLLLQMKTNSKNIHQNPHIACKTSPTLSLSLNA